MVIRDFTIADFDAVVILWQEAGLKLSLSDNREAIVSKLERDSDLFLVGVREDSVVGAVIGAFDGRRGWIYHLAIHPTCQGKGLGHELITELERRLRLKGCSKVNLLVESDNASVQHFYNRLEYRRKDLIFMEKWLA